MLYTVTLADGTKLEHLEYNGNNFVSQETIDKNIFTDNLSHVKVEIEESTTPPTEGEEDRFEPICDLVGEHTDLTLIQCMLFPEGWMFILAKPTHEQKVTGQIADIIEDQEATDEDIIDIQEALVDIYEQLINPIDG